MTSKKIMKYTFSWFVEILIQYFLTFAEKKLGNWTNDKGCQALSDAASCGPGIQQQIRICIDGSVDKCKESEIRRKISCAVGNCPSKRYGRKIFSHSLFYDYMLMNICFELWKYFHFSWLCVEWVWWMVLLYKDMWGRHKVPQ